ncbi:MAG: OmpA family protein [Campylobacteraceae bacterium]
MNKFSKSLLVLAFCSSSIFASGEFTPMIGGVHPSNDLQIDDHVSFGFRLGLDIEKAPIDQIELGFDYSTRVKYKKSNIKTDIARVHLNVIKDLKMSDKVTLYGLLGLGYEDVDKELYKNDGGAFGQYGVGVKYALTNYASLRAEVRHAIKFDDGNSNIFYSLGVSIPFGAKYSEETEPVYVETAKPIQTIEPAPIAVAPISAEPVVYGDSDGDGVTDDKDLCPNTPKGQKVDAVGCVKVISLKINFGFNKDTITPEFDEQIQTVAAILNSEKSYSVKLEGHTDSIGSDTYNLKLSERRAKAVANRLIELGVAKESIITEWYGEKRPIADNKTPEGRAENRRVDTTYSKQ